ncbi:hypothetical protein F4680DRAFT_448983 [Xylaria scruposa]|nr:hypothetical protein F4680DRAFT_448983 [Xylaria scruposa]
MSAVIAPRVIRVRPEKLDHSPHLYVQQHRNFIITRNEEWVGKWESPTVVRVNQQLRAAAATRQPSLNQHIRQGPANTNITYDELVRQRKIKEAKEAGQRIRRASRLLQQVTANGPTGGYSPLARKLFAASQAKKECMAIPFKLPSPTTRPGPQRTNAPRDLFQACGWTRDSGNRAGLPPRAGRDQVARRSEIPDHSKSPEIAAFTGKKPCMNFVDADAPTHNTTLAAPAQQQKRKRYIEDYPEQEMPLNKRR